MSLDAFRRLVRNAAIFFLVAPIPVAAAMLLVSENRILIAVSFIGALGIGVGLRIATRRFDTDIQSGFRLVEYCLYVYGALTLFSFVDQLFADPELFEREVTLNAVQFLGAVAVLVVAKKAIDGVKARSLAGQQTTARP